MYSQKKKTLINNTHINKANKVNIDNNNGVVKISHVDSLKIVTNKNPPKYSYWGATQIYDSLKSVWVSSFNIKYSDSLTGTKNIDMSLSFSEPYDTVLFNINGYFVGSILFVEDKKYYQMNGQISNDDNKVVFIIPSKKKPQITIGFKGQ